MNLIQTLPIMTGYWEYDYFQPILKYFVGIAGIVVVVVAVYSLAIMFFYKKDTVKYRWQKKMLIWCVVILIILFVLYAICNTPVYNV